MIFRVKTLTPQTVEDIIVEVRGLIAENMGFPATGAHNYVLKWNASDWC